MNILAVEDERLNLLTILDCLKEASPQSNINGFSNGEEALLYAKDNNIDVAFLDIELGTMSGLDLALKLKEINGKTNIIFVTGYSDYMGNAFSMHASGYILKPVTTDQIIEELKNLRISTTPNQSQKIRMQCFGNFEMYVDGKRIPFSNTRGKELLAYLVHRNGAGVTKAEIAAVFWEDKPYTRSLQNQLQKIIINLEKKLKEAGAGKLIYRSWGQISVDTRLYSSDYKDLLNGDTQALNTYNGEYMAGYSWAEPVTAYLLRQSEKNK